MTHDKPIRRALMIARKHREYGGADGTSTPTFDGTVVAGPPVLPSTTEPPSGPIQYIANIPPRIAETVRTIRSAASNVTPADVAQIAKSITFPDLMRGIGYNAYDILGAPVDLAAQATKVASHALPQAAFERVQRGLEKPILGSEWWREKAIEAGIAEPPKGTPGELIGEIGAGFVDPATVGKSVSLLAAKASPLLAVPMPAFKLRSGAADLIEAKGQPKATPQQYAAMPGIKPDEIKHSGFDALGTKAIPREQAAQHLRENAVPVEETQLGGKGRNTSPKFEEYSLPGGENYREVLLHLPGGEETRRARLNALTDQSNALLNGRSVSQLTPEERAKWDELERRHNTVADRDDEYKSSHWDEPNVLAHIRMSDRKGPNGEKVLHVEEIQSDWGQEGRERGFNPEKKEPPKLTVSRLGNGRWEVYNETHGRTAVDEDGFEAIYPTEREAHAMREQLLRDPYEMASGVPSGPYVDNTQKWTDLALKRVLHEAAHGGYDKVVFTPGDEQNKRYSLSKHVDELHYSPSEKKLLYKPKNQLGYAEKEIAPGDLPGAIGKEVAERLLATEPAQNWNTGSMAPLHSIKGKDLEVGGGGMRGYYDNIMPKRLQALAQQHDPQAKVRLHGHALGHPVRPSIAEIHAAADASGGDTADYAKYLENLVSRQPMLHALDVTPQMRDSIKAKGFNQFKRGGEVEPRRGAHPLVSHALKLTARKR